MTDAGNLHRLAELAGIEPFYHDIWGNYHGVSDATKRQLLQAMGLNAENDGAIDASIRWLEEAEWRNPLPPCRILREGEIPTVPLALPVGSEDQLYAGEVLTEDNQRFRISFRAGDLALEGLRTLGDGRQIEKRTLLLPKALPLGYHSLVIDGSGGGNTRLIVAPRSCYLPNDLAASARRWGIAAHLYTLRSERNWGIGDFSDLLRLTDVAASLGAATVGLNPLHALFPQQPERASPYSPSSRLFLNPLYLDVEGIDEFRVCDAARALVSNWAEELRLARADPLVDYTAVSARKGKVLELLFETFRKRHLTAGKVSDRGRQFLEFCRLGGELIQRFAIFEALSEHFEGAGWQQWPEPYRDPTDPAVAAFSETHAERVQYFQYLQWQADEQLQRVQHHARAADMLIGLYRDLAVGAAPDGAEAWSAQDILVGAASMGCPPDPFNMLGQDWGVPPLHPLALTRTGYEPFIAVVRANMRHAGALRIDHVMGLMHLFWIPAGETAAAGAYVRYPFEDMLAVLALESHRQRCLVIGEDLGTVPNGFRERMRDANVLSYKVLYFEKDGDRFKRPNEYPPLALACVSTHDLATLSGFWQGADIDLKQRLHLYPSDEAQRDERNARAHDRKLLLQALAAEGLLPPGLNPDNPDGTPMAPDLAAAIHRYLARSPAGIVLVQIDDLVAELEQINLPGTVDERPNWRRKLNIGIEALPGLPLVQALYRALADRRVTSMATTLSA
jgi:4-alpha-glucanotransferase